MSYGVRSIKFFKEIFLYVFNKKILVMQAGLSCWSVHGPVRWTSTLIIFRSGIPCTRRIPEWLRKSWKAPERLITYCTFENYNGNRKINIETKILKGREQKRKNWKRQNIEQQNRRYRFLLRDHRQSNPCLHKPNSNCVLILGKKNGIIVQIQW